jgi:hypothetical protein
MRPDGMREMLRRRMISVDPGPGALKAGCGHHQLRVMIGGGQRKKTNLGGPCQTSTPPACVGDATSRVAQTRDDVAIFLCLSNRSSIVVVSSFLGV